LIRGLHRPTLGFRRGKNQHRAIKQVRQAVVEGREWCVSIDLERFFDEIPHGLMLRLIRRKIQDERFVTLIARALKAGVIVEGQYEKTVKGCPQGSPMSPILSNIVLNELDQELERRGHR
jgi:RNA-directed DNA polymerase